MTIASSNNPARELDSDAEDRLGRSSIGPLPGRLPVVCEDKGFRLRMDFVVNISKPGPTQTMPQPSSLD